MTLLDCLHTFCGSCLADWFRWQQTAAENAPDPPTPDSKIFTCPSCRAHVRGTRHNATVATLLEMFLAANPDRARPEEEREEARRRYRPGDNVLPRIRVPEKSAEERRVEEMERRMLEQARLLSLQQDVGVQPSSDSERARRRRRREHSNSVGTIGGRRSDRDDSRDQRRRDDRDQSRRRGDHRRHRSEVASSVAAERRRGQSASLQDQSRDSSQVRRRRHVEHQASIRSLISSSDIDSRDLEREIEDFARHIQEEGLLEGLNLDNIDELSRNDELSRKITEAYRRRQRERSRQEPPARLGNASPVARLSESARSGSRSSFGDTSRPGTSGGSRPRSRSANTRPIIPASQSEDRSRPPVTSTHLEVRNNPERRPRRRTSSGGARSATDPVRPSSAETRPAARSQTDLTLPPQSGEPASSSSSSHRPSISEFRSSSMPTSNSSVQPPQEASTERGLPFSARATANPGGPARATVGEPPEAQSRTRRTRRPSDLVAPQAPLPSLGLLSTSPTAAQHSRSRSQYYPEPSIACSRCGRAHIEYELHYNCGTCRDGNWNLCLSCYRAGKGCLHWFGFGYAAFKKWERERERVRARNNNLNGGGVEGQLPDLEPPHMLTSNRFKMPKHTPGGAEGRRTLTTEDPLRRLESGSFCARCRAWANECFWRCDVCNEGDWGFCNTCVNQGFACTHPLLPLAYVAPTPPPQPQKQQQANTTPPGSGPPSPARSPSPSPSASPAPPSRRRPLSASLLTGPNAVGIGNFRPLTFTTTCDVCRSPIPPSQARYHCPSCVSHVFDPPDQQPQPAGPSSPSLPGDYDVCEACYAGLEREGRLAPENAASGWRRCLRGHRMVVVGFEDARGGQRRRVLADLVGGIGLRIEPYRPRPLHQQDQNDGAAEQPALQIWSWRGPAGGGSGSPAVRHERLVAVDVATAAPRLLNGAGADEFPPEGGVGPSSVTRWSWYPQPGADDELLFPRGAEVREVEDVNGDWFHGSYMGAVGLFPSPYVRVLER